MPHMVCVHVRIQQYTAHCVISNVYVHRKDIVAMEWIQKQTHCAHMIISHLRHVLPFSTNPKEMPTTLYLTRMGNGHSGGNAITLVDVHVHMDMLVLLVKKHAQVHQQTGFAIPKGGVLLIHHVYAKRDLVVLYVTSVSTILHV